MKCYFPHPKTPRELHQGYKCELGEGVVKSSRDVTVSGRAGSWVDLVCWVGWCDLIGEPQRQLRGGVEGAVQMGWELRHMMVVFQRMTGREGRCVDMISPGCVFVPYWKATHNNGKFLAKYLDL